LLVIMPGGIADFRAQIGQTRVQHLFQQVIFLSEIDEAWLPPMLKLPPGCFTYCIPISRNHSLSKSKAAAR
jgi:hypothetical protein